MKAALYFMHFRFFITGTDSFLGLNPEIPPQILTGNYA